MTASPELGDLEKLCDLVTVRGESTDHKWNRPLYREGGCPWNDGKRLQRMLLSYL